MTLEWDLKLLESPSERFELLALLSAETTPENLQAVAQYLVRYVRGPISHDEALVAIMDMSLGEFSELIKRLLGG